VLASDNPKDLRLVSIRTNNSAVEASTEPPVCPSPQVSTNSLPNHEKILVFIVAAPYSNCPSRTKQFLIRLFEGTERSRLAAWIWQLAFVLPFVISGSTNAVIEGAEIP
jgi:hypothetical protein